MGFSKEDVSRFVVRLAEVAERMGAPIGLDPAIGYLVAGQLFPLDEVMESAGADPRCWEEVIAAQIRRMIDGGLRSSEFDEIRSQLVPVLLHEADAAVVPGLISRDFCDGFVAAVICYWQGVQRFINTTHAEGWGVTRRVVLAQSLRSQRQAVQRAPFSIEVSTLGDRASALLRWDGGQASSLLLDLAVRRELALRLLRALNRAPSPLSVGAKDWRGLPDLWFMAPTHDLVVARLAPEFSKIPSVMDWMTRQGLIQSSSSPVPFSQSVFQQVMDGVAICSIPNP